MAYADFDIKVGDKVSFGIGTDVFPAIVIARTPKRVKVQEMSATLLNGVNSGEPDALQFSPGGFAGHTSGVQRWDIAEDDNGTIHTFTWREKQKQWLMKGTNHSRLHKGARKHYDFNF